ncbi:MAG: hypothetical protein PHV53_02275 [Fermentimonas sp.]|nr:hypothetical protein [Fermentimonas sp.]
MKKKILNAFTIVLLLSIALVACEKSDTFEGIDSEKVALQFRAVNSGTSTRSTNFYIDSFIMNVGEIEFDFDDDYYDDDDDFDDDDHNWQSRYGETYSYDDDLELKGPFEIALISDGKLQSEPLFANLELPNLYYEEIEFEMQKSRNVESPIFEKAILIEGEYNGVPFIFASDKEFELEIEFDKPYIPRDDLSITVDFYIDNFLNHSLPKFEYIFSQAVPDDDGVVRLFYFEDYDDDDYKTHYEYNYKLGEAIWKLFDDFDDIFDCDFD